MHLETTPSTEQFDLIVVGAGIIGLTAARAYRQSHPDAQILVLDKEDSSVRHGSGRNSGVIHSGIYYTPGSLRAKFCVEGARRMREYVDRHQIWNDPCGKLLIPTSESALAQIDALIERAQTNGVVARSVDAQEIRALEPFANTRMGRAIFIPVTRVTDPKAVMAALVGELKDRGVSIFYRSGADEIDTQAGAVRCGPRVYHGERIINAAGLYSDEVAHRAGLEMRYEFQPFKGKYWRYQGDEVRLSRLVYAVPDLNLPFLGVHSVHNARGELYFGPSSTPVLGRENYQGMEGLSLGESFSLGRQLLSKLARNSNGLRTLAKREVGLLFKAGLTREIQALIPDIDPDKLRLSGTKVGIRSQIFDPGKDALVTDFVTQRQGRCLHVLNAISPAFSASFAFADYLVEQLQ